MTAHMVQQDQPRARRYPHLLQRTVQHSTTWQGHQLRPRSEITVAADSPTSIPSHKPAAYTRMLHSHVCCSQPWQQMQAYQAHQDRQLGGMWCA